MHHSSTRALLVAGAAIALVIIGCAEDHRALPGSGGGASRTVSPSTSTTLATPAGAFHATGPLGEPRVHHTATLLASGLVLIVGGQTGASSVAASTELYDPATGRTTAGPPLREARMLHAAVMLPTGAVLVAGGQGDTAGRSPLASTELYDAITGTWSPGPDLATPRSAPAAALFRDAAGAARVLIAGGATFAGGAVTSLDSAELYLVASNTVTPAPAPMREDRFGARAITTSSGEVLVAGGYSGLGSPAGPRPASSELFEPAAGRFVTVPMLEARAECALVGASEPVALGGTDGRSELGTTESFARLLWSHGPSLVQPRRALAGVALLPAGAGPAPVLAVGGLDARGARDDCELVGSPGGPAPRLGVARGYATATLLADGSVLVAGGLGASGTILSSLEVYSARGAPVPGTLRASAGAAPSAPGGVELLPSAPLSSGVDVTALVPSIGVAGTTVTITGTGFDPQPSNHRVTFNGAPAAVLAVDVSNPRAQTLTVVVPANATSGPVAVMVGGITSPQAPHFTIAGSPIRPPVILAVAPSVGPVFMPVSITGQDFGPQPLVTFNGVPTASIVAASTQSLPLIGQVSTLVVLVPPGATSGPLVVRNGQLASAPSVFTVQ